MAVRQYQKIRLSLSRARLCDTNVNVPAVNEEGSGPQLHVESGNIKNRGGAPLPVSTCTPPCGAGHIKIRVVSTVRGTRCSPVG